MKSFGYTSFQNKKKKLDTLVCIHCHIHSFALGWLIGYSIFKVKSSSKLNSRPHFVSSFDKQPLIFSLSESTPQSSLFEDKKIPHNHQSHFDQVSIKPDVIICQDVNLPI